MKGTKRCNYFSRCVQYALAYLIHTPGLIFRRQKTFFNHRIEYSTVFHKTQSPSKRQSKVLRAPCILYSSLQAISASRILNIHSTIQVLQSISHDGTKKLAENMSAQATSGKLLIQEADCTPDTHHTCTAGTTTAQDCQPLPPCIRTGIS